MARLKLRGGYSDGTSTVDPFARVSSPTPMLLTPSASSDVGQRPTQQATGTRCQSYTPPTAHRFYRAY
jgi:hypothetical protein